VKEVSVGAYNVQKELNALNNMTMRREMVILGPNMVIFKAFSHILHALFT